MQHIKLHLKLIKGGRFGSFDLFSYETGEGKRCLKCINQTRKKKKQILVFGPRTQIKLGNKRKEEEEERLEREAAEAERKQKEEEEARERAVHEADEREAALTKLREENPCLWAQNPKRGLMLLRMSST